MNIEPIMNDEQKEQARQLNLIGELDRLHRVNWELQHKVDSLTLLLNEQISSSAQLREFIKKYFEEITRLRAESETLRRAMHDIYEVYAGSEGNIEHAEGHYLVYLIREMSDIAAEHKK